MKKANTALSSNSAWLVCLSGALIFFYAFIQMGMFNSLGEGMMRDWGIQASQIAKLSACYYYANILFLFPAGLLLDRFSTRHIMLAAIVIMVLTTALLALVSNIWQAMGLRFIFGIAGSFALLGNVRLASRWFRPEKMALVIGLVVMLAMTGGLVAQTPFTLVCDHWGWRTTVGVDAAIGAVIALAIYLWVQDSPTGRVVDDGHRPSMPLGQTIRLVLRNKQNWFAGLYTALMNLPVMVLIVFGALYLGQVHHLHRTQASIIIDAFLVGAILGSPVLGWLSDRIRQRRRPMLICAVIVLLLVMGLMLGHMSYTGLMLLFFTLGFFTSAQVISYPLIAESNPPELTATAEGVASVIIMSGGLVPVLFASLLRWHWVPKMVDNLPVYAVSNYQNALWILPVACVLSFFAAWSLRETMSGGKEQRVERRDELLSEVG